MRQTGRTDVTALPYGINTPSLFAYIFLVMGPVYQETRDPTLAWHGRPVRLSAQRSDGNGRRFLWVTGCAGIRRGPRC